LDAVHRAQDDPHVLLRGAQGYATAAALTGGVQRALRVSGRTALAAIPVAPTIIRRATSTRRQSGDLSDRKT
jgi:hypothetical protein